MAAELTENIKNIVGDVGLVSNEDWRKRGVAWETHQPCQAQWIVRPRNTHEVSAVMRLCAAAGQTVVPYGGLTNLVQGCVTTADDFAVSFERMNKIEEIDTTNHTMTLQAGVTMQAAQEAADAECLFFPVDIGARGTCMVGGNVSTNAGGTKVIRYGMMRDSVLGLEAVLADGTVVSSMNSFIKNNSGFDLKHLFIGTEGTLGLITRLVLRLSVKPSSHNVALVACETYDQVTCILNQSKQLLGSTLCGFEVMWDSFYSRVTGPDGRQSSPLDSRAPYYIIIESMGMRQESDETQFQGALEAMLEDELIVDAVVAKSQKEREEIWAIRGDVEWLVRDCYNFDVSLRVADVGNYVDDVNAKIVQDIPGAVVASFGHLGDNNIHISVLCDGNKTKHAKLIESHIYESLIPYGGAISAEHGIGLEKKPYLGISRTDEEIALMKTLKRSLDPANLLNPGKVVSID